MEQTDRDLHVLVLSTRDVGMLAAGARIFADVINGGINDMIENGRTVQAVSEMEAHRDHMRSLAERLDEEVAD